MTKVVFEMCYLTANSRKIGMPMIAIYSKDEEYVQPQHLAKHLLDIERLTDLYFILWRNTKDPRYREYAWEYVKMLYGHSGTGYGYPDLENVSVVPAVKRVVQQTQLLSATLKYLYLIFSPDDL